jgi:hypothetical protein
LNLRLAAKSSLVKLLESDFFRAVHTHSL